MYNFCDNAITETTFYFNYFTFVSSWWLIVGCVISSIRSALLRAAPAGNSRPVTRGPRLIWMFSANRNPSSERDEEAWSSIDRRN